MEDLLNELYGRHRFLETLEKTDENDARIAELDLVIFRIQQIILSEL